MVVRKEVCLTQSEWYVMDCLWAYAPQTVMQLATDLSQRAGWAKSTTITTLRRMEEKGLIRRTADENDQRQKQVTATEKGRELNSLVQAAFQEAEAVMVKGLRLEETEALRLLLYRVIENLEEDRTTC